MTAGGTPSVGSDLTAVLNRLDWQLGEIGRRQHRFAWLRDPSGDWLAVDSYYPGSRVVVVAADDPTLLSLCEDLVPRNGLFLVVISGDDLATDGADLVKRLRARLEIQGWAPRSEVPGGGPVAAPALPSRPAVVLAPALDYAPRLPRTVDRTPEPPGDFEDFDVPPDVQLKPRAAPARQRSSESEGMGVGITLVIVVVLELVVGGALIGLDAGQYVLGFGFLLDACARVLGMIVASQTGDLDAAWTSILFGSPALWGLERSESDVAPVARVTAILAGVVVSLGLVLVVI